MRPSSARSSLPRGKSLYVTRGSWISLFAMLMIFIGPLISQAMPMDHSRPMSMQMAMGEPGCHGNALPSAEHHAPPSDQHVLWEKCGYCSLLFSCPALPGGLTFIPLQSPPPANAIEPSTRLGHARQTVFPGARSRAPPIRS